MARLSTEEMHAMILAPLPEQGAIPFTEWAETIPAENRPQVYPALKNLKMSRTIRTYMHPTEDPDVFVHMIGRVPAQ